ncbi:MAG: hypothetical protein IJG32_06905, partial [Selenomonadaceae bacterium]|nr:hypothetical protein [Selenomonadaceae bacterium]
SPPFLDYFFVGSTFSLLVQRESSKEKRPLAGAPPPVFASGKCVGGRPPSMAAARTANLSYQINRI